MDLLWLWLWFLQYLDQLNRLADQMRQFLNRG